MQGCLANDKRCTEDCGGYDATKGVTRTLNNALRFKMQDDCQEGADWCCTLKPPSAHHFKMRGKEPAFGMHHIVCACVFCILAHVWRMDSC